MTPNIPNCNSHEECMSNIYDKINKSNESITKLETHYGYVRNDLSEVKTDIKQIKDTLLVVKTVRSTERSVLKRYWQGITVLFVVLWELYKQLWSKKQ